MATSKRSMATLVAASVWLATLGSAAAFTLRLNPRAHPQHRGVSGGAATCSSSVAAARLAAEPGVTTKHVLYLPSFIIAAPWPQGAATLGERAPYDPVETTAMVGAINQTKENHP
jgi:hypothetical protein